MTSKIIITVFFITKLSRFSIATQKSAEIFKDCPIQQYCDKGTHVVCMYYDTEKVFGDRCKNPVRIEVTPDMRHHILANINFLRGKVAMGTETGKYGEIVPKAYGLMKLEWDKKLAFSAQVLANQCLGEKKDECRGTERFQNPGQIIATIPFKYPNWEYLRSNYSERQQSLDEIKLIFAMDIFLRSLHASRVNVTKNIFTIYPKYDDFLGIKLRNYLNILYGGVTHIGCGVSAYTSGSEINGNTDTMKNIVQIVCNLSGTPKKSQPVYNVVRPIAEEGYTEKCGCPRGYQETQTCLCERKAKSAWTGLQLKGKPKTSVKLESRRSLQYRMSINEGIAAAEKTKDQLLKHAISKSRNFIVFRSA